MEINLYEKKNPVRTWGFGYLSIQYQKFLLRLLYNSPFYLVLRDYSLILFFEN
jgi:hypothetical protein